ncbi:hypothetical protein OG21DRAFT_1490061 [Imleria badia]|nr:hypothetical protein OG21DRAFT_1490061 [Imleria badia]
MSIKMDGSGKFTPNPAFGHAEFLSAVVKTLIDLTPTCWEPHSDAASNVFMSSSMAPPQETTVFSSTSVSTHAIPSLTSQPTINTSTFQFSSASVTSTPSLTYEHTTNTSSSTSLQTLKLHKQLDILPTFSLSPTAKLFDSAKPSTLPTFKLQHPHIVDDQPTSILPSTQPIKVNLPTSV